MRRSLLLVVTVAALLCAAKASPSDDPTLVQTLEGWVRGFVDGIGVSRAFLGIPFAAPPVGDLRWRAPAPSQGWYNVRDTTQFPSPCAQHGGGDSSEDCLYLNVFTPMPEHMTSPVPVMVFIHGGSYTTGSTSVEYYNGTNPVAQSVTKGQPVIVVTIQYRLNAFGFLGSDMLQTREKSTGNFGILDQRAALQWVLYNIASFGGNASAITVFGESAGGGSIANHLVRPASTRLFHRAIMESGPFAFWAAQNFSTSNETFYHLMTALNCSDLPCLLNSSTDAILHATSAVDKYAKVFLQWAPTVDGVDLLDHPVVLAREGKFGANMPVMMGSNRDEGTEFIDFVPYNITEGELALALAIGFGDSAAQELLQLYPMSAMPPNNSAWWAASHMFGDCGLSCPTRDSATWLTEAGSPSFLYFFQHPPFLVSTQPFTGCPHAAELIFVFHDDDVLLGPGEPDLATSMVQYWQQFAVAGNPNAQPNPNWPQYDTVDDVAQVLDVGNISALTNLKQKQCDFWASYNHPLAQEGWVRVKNHFRRYGSMM